MDHTEPIFFQSGHQNNIWDSVAHQPNIKNIIEHKILISMVYDIIAVPAQQKIHFAHIIKVFINKNQMKT